MIKHLLGLAVVVGAFVAPTANAEVIKLSNSGICHDSTSSFYTRTKTFEAHATMDSCLDAGGRLPKSYSGPESTQSTKEYDRDLFPHWLDTDGDCQNTRQTLLITQSVEKVDFRSRKGCTVDTGAWLDPYSGKVFDEASDVHIDHIVPLYHAFQHGADEWSLEKRTQFANDYENLRIVSASLNTSKGADDFTKWLPPSKGYQCEYSMTFIDIAHKYGLKYNKHELEEQRKVLNRVCGLN